jgi:hypothetical protein
MEARMNALSHHPGRVVAIGVMIAVALMSLLPTSWADAQTGTAGTPIPTLGPFPTPRPFPAQTPLATPVAPTVTLVNEVVGGVSTTQATRVSTTGVGVSSDDTIAVDVPAGAMPAGASVSVGVITNSEDLQRQAPPPRGVGLVLPLQITATRTDGSGITENFNEPVQISVDIPDIGVSGNLTMAFWNGTQWIQVNTVATVNPATGRVTLTATVDHFTIFAVFVVDPEAVDDGAGTDATDGTPTAPTPADTGMGTESGATDTMAIVLGLVALAGILGVGTRLALARRTP